jgi:hypothetical protein
MHNYVHRSSIGTIALITWEIFVCVGATLRVSRQHICMSQKKSVQHKYKPVQSSYYPRVFVTANLYVYQSIGI